MSFNVAVTGERAVDVKPWHIQCQAVRGVYSHTDIYLRFLGPIYNCSKFRAHVKLQGF